MTVYSRYWCVDVEMDRTYSRGLVLKYHTGLILRRRFSVDVLLSVCLQCTWLNWDLTRTKASHHGSLGRGPYGNRPGAIRQPQEPNIRSGMEPIQPQERPGAHPKTGAQKCHLTQTGAAISPSKNRSAEMPSTPDRSAEMPSTSVAEITQESLQQILLVVREEMKQMRTFWTHTTQHRRGRSRIGLAQRAVFRRSTIRRTR